jgi:type I restriction enzyme, S subunit
MRRPAIEFKNFVTLQRGFDLPKSQMKHGDVPVLGSNCIIGYHDEFKVTAPGVVTGRSGTLGLVQFVDKAYWPHNTALWVKDFKGSCPKFVYYKLQTLHLETFNGGASVPTLNRNVLDNLPIQVPDTKTQERIADILSAYDDLIENNRRRMTLLEEAARQLYLEWFVRLRFPGHEHAHITSGVPEGWEKKTLAEVCGSLEDGDWIESKDQSGEDFRLLQISNIGINEFVETGNFRYVTEQTFKRLNCREISPGQILISRMPTPIGRAWLVTPMPWRMITAVDVAILTTNDNLADAYFLTQFLNSPASLEHCARRAVGATRPRVAKRELATLPLILPPRTLQRDFRETAEPIHQQRANLYRQNEKLRAARDLLLPRLMSGEVVA